MVQPIDVYVYFNFRSPYCYLASKTMFSVFDEFYTKMVWRPLGGYNGRSAPKRAKIKMTVARQDVERHTRKMGIPFCPPPKNTDPTLAGVLSLVAEREGLLKPYVQMVMDREWAKGEDIGDAEVLLQVGEDIGLSRGDVLRSLNDEQLRAQIKENWHEAEKMGVIGVPTFVVKDQIFWGNDRLEFLRDYLREQCVARI